MPKPKTPKIHPFVYVIGLLFLILLGTLLFMDKGVGSSHLLSQAQYTCNEEKIIQAQFYAGEVRLTLNDGKRVVLTQGIAGAGTKYTNGDESFVFLTSGNTARVMEAGVETYSNCVTAADLPIVIEEWEEYSKPLSHYRVNYPPSYSINASYVYDQLGSERLIRGVKFTIPSSIATGTNLSSNDTGVSVEEISHPASCTASRFLDQPQNIHTISEEGIDYSVAESIGAAAGNRYEERVYVLQGTEPCLAVRYFIHSTNIGNYEPGVVREFDRASLLLEFDKIRRSLEILK